MAAGDLNVILQGKVGPVLGGDGTQFQLRQARCGSAVVSQSHGRYAEAARRGNLFMAHAIVTSPVIYTTAAGTGGPVLHNASSGTYANILAVGFGMSVVPIVAAAIGITGGIGQGATAMGATTAIDSQTNLSLGGNKSQMTLWRIATPAAAGTFFLPFAHLHTGALTVDTTGVQWIDLNGMLVVPPGGWCAVAASATATTAVASISMIWEELPAL